MEATQSFVHKPNKLVYFLANGLAGVMDFGVGALLATLITLWFGEMPTVPTVFFGGVAALLPDLDILPRILQLRFVDFDHHTTILHRPLFLVPFATALAFWLGGPVWAIIYSLGVTYHFLHDTAWSKPSISGIAWLWPFSSQCFAYWGFYQQPNTMPHQAWLDRYWLKPSPKSIFELTIGIGTLLVAIYLTAVPALLILPALALFAIVIVWSA